MAYFSNKFSKIAPLGIVSLILIVGIPMIFSIYGSMGVLLYSILYLCQLPKYLTSLMKIIKTFDTSFIPKRDVFLFFPSEIGEANARFIVVSNMLETNSCKQDIAKPFHFFHEGLDIYNDYLRSNYGFVMCDVGHFYTSAKLALHSVSNEESVKIGFKELIRGMNDKKEPFEILRILKHMIKEPIDYKNMCTSLEVEPKRTRKWVSCHSTEIGIITGIASAVIAELIKVIIEQNWSLISQAFQSFVFSL